MEMRILRGGLLTTVQDAGRRGHRASGVPLSGAMDPFALRIANLLVGNAEPAAALEFTLNGPSVEFSADTLVAIGGASCEGAPAWQRLAVRAGERLELGRCVHGCRGYLAIAGGVDVPPVLGSASTYLRGGFGGHEGRALRDGDVVNVAGSGTVARPPADGVKTWRLDPRLLPAYSAAPRVRVVRCADTKRFDAAFAHEFRVSPQSDRMGVRLAGVKVGAGGSGELLSAAVTPGTVQVPPDGQPLVLMADAQTIGGYPQLGQVATVDLPLIAQLRPGDALRFVAISLEEAQLLLSKRERALGLLRQGLVEKWKSRER